MITPSELEPIAVAVPSFKERWKRILIEAVDDPASIGVEFQYALCDHLTSRAAVGDFSEFPAFFEALERAGNFLRWCAGMPLEALRSYPTEKAKYGGIGGAVLTTGVIHRSGRRPSRGRAFSTEKRSTSINDHQAAKPLGDLPILGVVYGA